jgi:hypothetical protein
MCVIPARDAAPMFSGVQIPPPTPIRSVTHVTSIPILSRVTRTFLPAGFFPEVPLPGCAAASAGRSLAPFVSNRGEIESPGARTRASVSWLRFILRYPPRLRGLRGEPSLSLWHSSSCWFPSFSPPESAPASPASRCWFRYACHRNHWTFPAIYRIRRQTHSLQQPVSQRIFRLCQSLCCRRVQPHRFEQILRRSQVPTLSHFNESTD